MLQEEAVSTPPDSSSSLTNDTHCLLQEIVLVGTETREDDVAGEREKEGCNRLRAKLARGDHKGKLVEGTGTSM